MHQRLRARSLLTCVVLGLALGRTAASSSAEDQVETRTGQARLGGYLLVQHESAISYQRAFPNEHLRAWRRRVPGVKLVQIRSSIDRHRQKVLWYDSGSARDKPLLVALHSWSADYQQNLDIPFAEFAIANDWVFVHPDFRGPNRHPQSAASDLAVQDVLDAVDFARRRGRIDSSRIFAVGYSGGAMKALVLAGRHPELWAAVAAWGGVYDIVDWYHHNNGRNAHYVRTIEASCGGPPTRGSSAEASCRTRSPMTHLARAAGRVAVLIGHGLRDDTVPPRHAILAFDELAAPEDRFTEAQRNFIDTHGKLPDDLRESSNESSDDSFTTAAPLFERAGGPIRLHRRSRNATLVLFDGGHDMLYNPTLDWFAQQRRSGSRP